MSFSNDIKKEIAQTAADDCCLKAEIYEIIRLRGSVSYSNRNFKITIATTSLSTTRRLVYLFRRLYNAQAELLKQESNKLDRKPLYLCIITDKIDEIIEDLDILNSDYSVNEEVSQKFLMKECCKTSFLRAAFLARGSINDPSKSKYHLEIVTPTENDAKAIQSILSEIGIEAKTVNRQKGIVVYIKKAENIADFLKFIGASNSLFTFEDLRIKKDLSNYVNRIMNCDVANEQKAIATAAIQLENISYLNNNCGIMNLTPRLVDAIVLRTTFPDDSLSQLSEKSEETVGHYISKSGLSHCFRDINSLVSRMKKK